MTLPAEIQQALLDRCYSAIQQTSLEGLFARKVLQSLQFLPRPMPSEKIDAARVLNNARNLRSYADLARLGYLLDLSLIALDQGIEAFSEGFNRLQGRDLFSGDIGPTFPFDDYAVMGVALGLSCLPRSASKSHAIAQLASIVEERLRRDPCPRLTRRIHTFVLDQLRATTHSQSLAAPQGLDEWAFALWANGHLSKTAAVTLDLKESGTLLQEVLLQQLPDNAGVAALRAAAIENLVRITFGSVSSVEKLIAYLDRFEHALRRWRWDDKPKRGKAVRWIINDEYHVQDILWVMLAPLFPDLEDEENLPSIGQRKPRADLGIPTLGTIIEVKFVRRKGDFAELVGQVAEDANLYFARQQRYQRMIAFVYDDSQSTQEHEVCRRGLEQLPKVVKAVIVSRPSKIPSANQR